MSFLTKSKKTAEEKPFRNKKNKLDKWTLFDYINSFVMIVLIFITYIRFGMFYVSLLVLPKQSTKVMTAYVELYTD